MSRLIRFSEYIAQMFSLLILARFFLILPFALLEPIVCNSFVSYVDVNRLKNYIVWSQQRNCGATTGFSSESFVRSVPSILFPVRNQIVGFSEGMLGGYTLKWSDEDNYLIIVYINNTRYSQFRTTLYPLRVCLFYIATDSQIDCSFIR